MKLADSRRATGLAIVGLMVCVLLLNVVVIILHAMGPPEGSILNEIMDQLTRIRIGFSLLMVAMVFIIVVMYTNEFRTVRSGEYQTYDFVLMTIFCIGITLIVMLNEAYVSDNYLTIATVGIVIAGFIGRTRMALITTAAIALISLLIYPSYYPMEVILTGLVVLVSMGICISIICAKGYSVRAMKLCIILNFAYIIGLFLINLNSAKTVNLTVDTILSIIFMIIAVVFYAHNLKIIESAEEGRRTKDELAIAHKIQANAIPTKFEHSSSLEYHGMMESAIEMSGDFYDCFEIRKNMTAIVVADVSDKGLVAALFMMRTKASIKSVAMVESRPEKILEIVNNDLCNGNPNEQFVTAWVGIIDSDTGMLYFSDAGHTVPYIGRKGGRFESLKEDKGFLLGVFEDMEYTRNSVKLEDGDTVFIYTDGVNEAMNGNDEQYGHGRLVSALDHATGSCEEVIGAVREDIRKFVSGNIMSDDITMFCLRTKRSDVFEISVKAKAENLNEVIGFIESHLVGVGCPDDYVKKMDIVAEEIFVNICTHAYPEGEGDVSVYCRFRNGEIKLTFEDSGTRFDPVQRSEVVISNNVAEWTIGGFGIHMVKKLVDSMEYKRVCDTNVFTVRKNVKQGNDLNLI